MTERAKNSTATRRVIDLERTLTYRLHLLHKLTDAVSGEAYLNDCGVPISEGRCLSVVGTFKQISVADLAQRVHLHKGQASRAAQALVERGLVRKAASVRDRRGVVLTLTRKGRVAWSGVMDLVARRNEEIFGCLNQAELNQLSRMFDRLVERATSAE